MSLNLVASKSELQRNEVFEDLIEWIEPPRTDGQPRAFRMKDRAYFLSRCRPLGESVLDSPENTKPYIHMTDK